MRDVPPLMYSEQGALRDPLVKQRDRLVCDSAFVTVIAHPLEKQMLKRVLRYLLVNLFNDLDRRVTLKLFLLRVDRGCGVYH